MELTVIIRGTADADGWTAWAERDAYDPLRTAARPKSCTAQVLTWSPPSGMLRAFRIAAT
jgi:hypothetical protein